MMNRITAIGLLLLFLSGCIATPTKEVLSLGDRMLADVLNSKPDGYIGAIGSSQDSYKIVSTKISNSGVKLCRVLSVESENEFKVETYCKMKGGNWQ